MYYIKIRPSPLLLRSSKSGSSPEFKKLSKQEIPDFNRCSRFSHDSITFPEHQLFLALICFHVIDFSNAALRPQSLYGLLETRSPGRPPRLSHSSWALYVIVGWVLLYVHRNCRLIRDGSPGRPPRLSHSSWAQYVIVFVVTTLYLHEKGWNSGV